MRHARQTLRVFAFWLVIAALTCTVMAPGLNGGFLFDDNPNIVENQAIQIDTLSVASLKASTTGLAAGPLGRPVSVISFALTHYYFGLDPFAFKAINLALHLLNGILVAWLAALLLPILRNAPLTQKEEIWLPCWVAAIWLIHPINVLPVLLSVQRMTLLAGMFLLLAMIGHLKAFAIPGKGYSKWLWLGASWLVFWPLSILSKESGLLFPLYVLVVTFVAQPQSAAPLHRKPWTVLATVCLLLLIVSVAVASLGWGWLDTAYAIRPFTLTERLLTEARVLWFYAAQIVVPSPTAFGLYLDDFSLSTGILAPLTTLLALTGWIGLTVAVIYWRKSQPVLCFAAAWFLAGHALESTFLPLEIAHEYRNYLPSIGLIIGVASVGLTLLPRLSITRRTLIVGAIAVTPVLVLALFTWMRAGQLGNPIYGSQIEAANHPQSARANYSAALALIQAGHGDSDDPVTGRQIRSYLQQSSQADPSFKYGNLAMIVWSCSSGRQLEKQWVDDLANRLEYTFFSPRDRELPRHMLNPLLAMPTCLDKQDVQRLFMAGANNRHISQSLQVGFREAAAFYQSQIAEKLR